MLDGLSSQDRLFLQNLSRSQDRASRAQSQLSSGYRVSAASDDPAAAAGIISARSDLARTQQVQTNLGLVKNEVDTAEQGLAQAVRLLDEARTAGARGGTTSVTAMERQTLADQVGGIMTSLVQIANTQVNGRYVFSGDNDQQAAYSIDLTQPTPLSTFQGTNSTRQVLSASGSAISIGRTAQQIFDSGTPANNVFSALTALRTALLANDPTATTAALDTLHTAADHLNTEHALYGGMQNAISAAKDEANQRATSVEVQRSQIQDADPVEAALTAAQARTAVETALSAHAQRGRKSLFDYLA